MASPPKEEKKEVPPAPPIAKMGDAVAYRFSVQADGCRPDANGAYRPAIVTRVRTDKAGPGKHSYDVDVYTGGDVFDDARSVFHAHSRAASLGADHDPGTVAVIK